MDYVSENNIMWMLDFLNLMIIFWLHRRMFIHAKVFRSEGSRCLQFTLKWFSENNDNSNIYTQRQMGTDKVKLINPSESWMYIVFLQRLCWFELEINTLKKKKKRNISYMLKLHLPDIIHVTADVQHQGTEVRLWRRETRVLATCKAPVGAMLVPWDTEDLAAFQQRCRYSKHLIRRTDQAGKLVAHYNRALLLTQNGPILLMVKSCF